MSKWEIVGNNMLVNDDFKNDAALLLSGDWNSEEEMQNFLTDVCNKLNGYAEIKSEESIGNEPYRKPSENVCANKLNEYVASAYNYLVEGEMSEEKNIAEHRECDCRDCSHVLVCLYHDKTKWLDLHNICMYRDSVKHLVKKN